MADSTLPSSPKLKCLNTLPFREVEVDKNGWLGCWAAGWFGGSVGLGWCVGRQGVATHIYHFGVRQKA